MEALEKIANEAFEDELQKIAKSEAFAKILSKLKGAGKAVAGAGKKVGGAYKSSAEELKGLKGLYGRTSFKGIMQNLRSGNATQNAYAKSELKALGKHTAKAALIPATVTGIGLAGYKASKGE